MNLIFGITGAAHLPGITGASHLLGLPVLRTFRGLPPLRSGDPRNGEAESKKNTAAVCRRLLQHFCFLAFANKFATL